ncbi:hypothetical protein TrLO_g6880 [Triparma laevis f. longispina]|uniref:V-ATPase proteolipid subunit C-like domain-containing protein n=1 Tax=Triparma laevis f. longispina TaxID=1714387 RepID=A0A9W7C6W2_9STRA|nr:hypothetical protein TrLO_g6880 [Triparma laevis f. longispina]
MVWYNGLQEQCPPYAPVLGYLGVALCIFLGNMGSAIGTYGSGPSILVCSIRAPRDLFKNLLPVIMSNILGVYSMVVGIIIIGGISSPVIRDGIPYSTYSLYSSLAHFAAGLCCGMTCLVSGNAIGTMGSAFVRCILWHNDEAWGDDYDGERGLQAVDEKSSLIRNDQMEEKNGGQPYTEDPNAPPPPPRPTRGGDKNAAGQVYVAMVISLIFAEAIALYGTITAVVMVQKGDYHCDVP